MCCRYIFWYHIIIISIRYFRWLYTFAWSLDHRKHNGKYIIFDLKDTTLWCLHQNTIFLLTIFFPLLYFHWILILMISRDLHHCSIIFVMQKVNRVVGEFVSIWPKLFCQFVDQWIFNQYIRIFKWIFI